ncbi:Signal peptidase I T [bacterium HR35]|nr:Signal peptidase I T [bacterium HR35]
MSKKYFLEILEIILILSFLLPIRIFLFEPFFVKGSSMEPNYYSFDYLIVDKISYHFTDPQRGDVVVFHPPFDNKVYYIKRIIGLPGERVVIKDSKIFIYSPENPQGKELKEPYLQEHYTSGSKDIALGKDEYFVLGDNREISSDSRSWGPVKRERIIGKVIFHLSFKKIIDEIKPLIF